MYFGTFGVFLGSKRSYINCLQDSSERSSSSKVDINSSDWDRTSDIGVNSSTLYLLSYRRKRMTGVEPATTTLEG
jgi:hypothetical protein